MVAPTITISADEVAFYHREGYLAVARSLSTPDELVMVRGIYDRLFTEMAGWEQGSAFDLAGTDDDSEASLPQILGPSKWAPELKETLYYANAYAIAKQLLGPECQMGGDHAILKPAFKGSPAPWHQDEAYWNPDIEYHSLSVWVPLQDAPVESGCLHFVPGTHRMEVLSHHTIGHDPRIHALEIDPSDRYDLSTAVACPLRAGGATLHYSRTMHYAGPNLTDRPRRAYIIGFGIPPTRRAEPRDFYWNAGKQTARQKRAADALAKRQAETAR